MNGELFKRLKAVGQFNHLSDEQLIDLYKKTLEDAKRQTGQQNILFYDDELAKLNREIQSRGLEIK